MFNSYEFIFFFAPVVIGGYYWLGKEASTLTSFVRLACLIIDEIGHCEFDKESTRLFFDMVDRRYNKEGLQPCLHKQQEPFSLAGELQ